MKLNLNNIFLFDGIGALFSASLSGLILPLFLDWLGLTSQVVYSMAVIAVFCAVYSLSCYKFAKPPKQWMLLLIMLVNLSYCVFTAVIAFGFHDITEWGRIFLIGEILVILGVVAVEYRVYKS